MPDPQQCRFICHRRDSPNSTTTTNYDTATPTFECELNWFHEGFLCLSGSLSIRVSGCDDVPNRPRGSPAVESRRPNHLISLEVEIRTATWPAPLEISLVRFS
jgi:hypothetical protein